MGENQGDNRAEEQVGDSVVAPEPSTGLHVSFDWVQGRICSYIDAIHKDSRQQMAATDSPTMVRHIELVSTVQSLTLHSILAGLQAQLLQDVHASRAQETERLDKAFRGLAGLYEQLAELEEEENV